jgi:hypothetical protein
VTVAKPADADSYGILHSSAVHASHDVREEGFTISDPICQHCRMSAASPDCHEALRQPCKPSLAVKLAPFTDDAPVPMPLKVGEVRGALADAEKTTDRWWAQRWLDKATPGELAAMREILG